MRPGHGQQPWGQDDRDRHGRADRQEQQNEKLGSRRERGQTGPQRTTGLPAGVWPVSREESFQEHRLRSSGTQRDARSRGLEVGIETGSKRGLSHQCLWLNAQAEAKVGVEGGAGSSVT